VKRTLLSAVFSFVWLSKAGGYDGGASSEYQLKAAFLLKFASFVEWPATVFTNPAQPLILGVFGEAAVGAALDEAAKGRALNGRQVMIRFISDPAALPACNIVFFPRTGMRGYTKSAKALLERNVLTVGEANDFIERGGIINFVIHDGRLRFKVNMAAAEAHHLKISSKLLQLAVESF
jgi:hypothetical protein